MRRRWRVRFTRRAAEDLLRLVEFLAERNPALGEEARDAILRAVSVLERLPFSARPARLAGRSTLRELIVPFARSGYVVLVEVERETVTVVQVRHQREGDLL